MSDYIGIVASTRDHQRRLNAIMSDAILALDAKPKFEKWFSEFKFGYGSNWMKPLFKQYFWWGYFAGYKRGLNK